MDFILDNLYLLIFAAAGIAQWVNSQREAKKAEMEAHRRREQPEELEEEEDVFGPDFDFGETQENHEREVERRAPAPATPPPLPSTTTVTSSGPLSGPERSPVPSLRRNPAPQIELTAVPSRFEEELARQAEMLEQVRVFKQAKSAKSLEEAAALKTSSAYALAASGRGTGETGLRARLRNTRELKQALVMKEVLDKPVGLRH